MLGDGALTLIYCPMIVGETPGALFTKLNYIFDVSFGNFLF